MNDPMDHQIGVTANRRSKMWYNTSLPNQNAPSFPLHILLVSWIEA